MQKEFAGAPPEMLSFSESITPSSPGATLVNRNRGTPRGLGTGDATFLRPCVYSPFFRLDARYWDGAYPLLPGFVHRYRGHSALCSYSSGEPLRSRHRSHGRIQAYGACRG